MSGATITTTFKGIIALTYVNKFWHNQITRYAIDNNKCNDWLAINRQLSCEQIASEGFLKVLQWARQNGCEWNSWMILFRLEYRIAIFPIREHVQERL